MATKKLFRVDCSGIKLWTMFLEKLPAEINPIYKENKMHDCFSCHGFFKRAANVVAVDEETYEVITLFGCEVPDEYQGVFNELDEYVKSRKVSDIFIHDESTIGHKCNHKLLEDGSIMEFQHFYIDVPRKCRGNPSDISEVRSSRIVLENSTEQISLDAVDTVLELISTNSLYRGDVWKENLEIFRDYLVEYQNTDIKDHNLFYWIKSLKLGSVLVRIKNKSIGTLLVDISNEMPLDEAVRRYEDIVAPTNYKRPKPIFTSAMLEKAQNKIEELGFADSIPRRFAVMDDLSVSDVLFANRDLTKGIKGNKTVFDKLKDLTVNKALNFDKVQDIPLNDFIENVLPNAQEIELYLDYDLKNNFMSLIAPINKDAPSMFKWDNSFSWAYRNNIADSLMKQRVKSMGGDVDVDLRFTIQWNDHDIHDKNDLDAHCTEPDGHEIYYSAMRSKNTGGWLDVDIIHPKKDEPAVENIQYKNRHNMTPGDYLFRVHQYDYRGGDRGFKAEIEFDGRIYNFIYPHKLSQKEYVDVARVTLHDDYSFTIKNFLENKVGDLEEWGVKFNSFIPVSLVCYSPNYWGDNAYGNKHIFFMLKDCVTDERPNPWFNEFLVNELNDHRKVMEALGSVAKVEESDNQLSGIGFSFTQKNKVTLKVKTENIDRVLNVII
jgi:hypothetical protein